MTFLKHSVLVSAKHVPLSLFALASLATALAATLSACSGSANIPVATASGPQLYMAPVMAGGTSTGILATYSIDDAKKTFAQTTYDFSDTQTGAQVQYSGNIAVLQRGFVSLDLTYPCVTSTTNGCAGGWALELAGQAGGLAQIKGSPFVPLVAANSCPSMTTAETFQFVTLPASLVSTGTNNYRQWNPQQETAYGSVDISASGSTVTLANIKQNILPSEGGGTAANAPSSSVTGACSSTVYGNTVSVPAQVTITNPGSSQAATPQALVGIGPSGLLVEDNGSSASTKPSYQNALGAGTGAIGLPKPSSALDTGVLVGAQYLGFYYGGGKGSNNTGWLSAPVSFGFSAPPSGCASTKSKIYGGDFTNNDPTTSTTGYGKCDFAIDLGVQDTSNNGLYPAATVYVPGFGTNTTGYSFSAVAIAGQLNGKYAIFVIGVNTVGSPNRAWGIYLLQSN